LSQRAWILPLCVFAVACVLRLAYVHQSAREIGLDSDRLTQLDTFVFAQWARVIAEGDLLCWQQPHAYHLWTEDVAPESKWLEWYGGERTYHQAPLYPYCVAAVYWALGQGSETLGAVQAVLGALTCALTAVLARRLVSPFAGWVAGLLLALMGQFYFYDAFTLRDGPLALLVVMLALTLDTAVKRGRVRDWLAAGAVLGLFTLAKETGLPLLLLVLLVLAWVWRREPRRVARALGLLLLGWGLVTAPAFARNRYVDAPTFKLSTRGPEVLVVGNARGQDGVGWEVPSDTLRRILVDANFRLGRTALLTLATHRAEPWGFVELQWNKTAAFFNGYEEPNNANFYLHRAHLSTLKAGWVPYGLVSALALFGLLLGLPRRHALAVPYLLFVALTASVIALYVLGRFRVHVLPLMALFAALTVDWVVRCVRARRSVALVLAVAPLFLLFRWTAPGGQASLYYADERGKNTSMMMLLLKSGNYVRALEFYDRLRAALGDDLPTGQLTYVPAEGTLEARLAAIDDAFAQFRESTRWPDDQPQHHLALGRGFTALLGSAERYEFAEITNLAREQFGLALDAAPDLPGAHLGLARVHARNGHFGLAFAELNDELQLHPDDRDAHHDAGVIRLEVFKDEPRALQHFREALALGLVDDGQMLACMAHIEINTTYRMAPPLRVRGAAEPVYDMALGLRHAREALRLLPDDPLVMEKSAAALYANGFYDEAVALLQRLAGLQPERAAELQNRADLYRMVEKNKASPAGTAPPIVDPAPSGGGPP
jgi:4-amino-4-deoxy-L-arabinose transferase-like glycosyltransferase